MCSSDLLVQEVFATEGADGAEVYNISGQLVVTRNTRENVDLFNTAATHYLHFSRATNLAREANTASTHYASVGEERDLVADVIFIRLNVLRFLKSAIATSIFVAVILQSAFTSLVTDWAVEGVIKQ